MGSVYQRGDSWVGQYKDRGKTVQKTLGKKSLITKTMAREIVKKIEHQIKLGKYDMLDAEIPSFSDYAEEYVAYQREVKRIRSHERTRQCVGHFARYFGDLKLNEISTDHIDLYKQKRLAESVKQNTVARELQVIRNLFNHAAKRNKFFGKNPVSESGIQYTNDKKERVLTIEEEKRLLEVSPIHLKHVIQIALNTGMRRGEILGLQWDWIDFEENYIYLPQTHTKSQKSRKIPINEIVRRILLERKLLSGGSQFVFPSEESKTGHLNWLKRSFTTACKNAKIEDLRFHDLRHTAATRLVESGIPLHAVAKLLGHSTVRVTERYSHPEESVKKGTDILASYTMNR
jgi:integrase